MYDKILRWYIEGGIMRVKSEVGGTYTLDADYKPDSVILTDRIAGTGEQPLVVDITADGTSIFSERPSMPTGISFKEWTTVDSNVIREGTVIRLDITSAPELTTAQDLTVELRLTI